MTSGTVWSVKFVFLSEVTKTLTRILMFGIWILLPLTATLKIELNREKVRVRKCCNYTKPSTDGNELHPSNSNSCVYDIETHSRGEQNYGDLVDQKKIEQKLSSVVKQFQIFFCFARQELNHRKSMLLCSQRCVLFWFIFLLHFSSCLLAACQCSLMIH